MIRLVHTLGGCGGTLLSRCLGVLPGTALFSEINPLAVHLFPAFDPLRQDREWLHLLGPGELARFSAVDLRVFVRFRELISALDRRAAAAGRKLILRDYNYIDFIGVPYLAAPPRRRVIYQALPTDADVRAVAFVRHPIDQWLSLCKHTHVRNVLPPDLFCDAYDCFLGDLGGTPIFRYEDFVERPGEEMQRICERLEFDYDHSFLRRFRGFDNVTGDFSRHREGTIAPSIRNKPELSVLERFRSARSFRRICDVLAYDELLPWRQRTAPQPVFPRAPGGLQVSRSPGQLVL